MCIRDRAMGIDDRTLDCAGLDRSTGRRGEGAFCGVSPVAAGSPGSVSYTHLDVYKRQEQGEMNHAREGKGRFPFCHARRMCMHRFGRSEEHTSDLQSR